MRTDPFEASQQEAGPSWIDVVQARAYGIGVSGIGKGPL